VPSEKQLRWSQLRVGLTVIFSGLVLALLIFLMSGNTGLFGKKLVLKSYFQNTAGLRVGAPVTLEGVGIGNVKEIRVVAGRQLDPVEVTMKVGGQYAEGIKKDSIAILSTAGVLGELFVDINSKRAHGERAKSGDVLRSEGQNSIEDVMRAGQATLANMDILLKRADKIVAGLEEGQGSIGKVLKDPELYNRANKLVAELQVIVDSVNNSKGSIGKLLNNDELYNKVNASVDKINKIVDEIDSGKGSIGKLLKDDALYNNANETIGKANHLMDDINAGKGALGMMTKDEQFAKKINNMVTNLARLSEDLEAGKGSAGKLFKDPSLYNNSDQMLVETRNLVKAIRENPKKYLTIYFKLF